ncbi:MAG: hypothetical protein CML29_17500 [Rhizobiales bacterium]|nr:hypothetical protein [Hyphomicrobiales bacterium]MBA68622.1 hypothetical protein [Hyphomicrobiales bacterium]|tara:strand:+ start:2373 stop:3509 length:1137 start_codon:yes stop_codon:yes gene_type:complete
MRDWRNAFLPASYRGAAFKVDIESGSFGRRLAIAPIAYSDEAVIEDMGGMPDRFQVTAYCAGDLADAQCKALLAVLKRKGGGLLMLPMLGPKRCRAEQWGFTRYKVRAGFVGIDIDFVVEGLSAVPLLPSAAAGMLSDLAAAVIPAMGSAFASQVRGASGGVRDDVAAAAVSSAQTIATISDLAGVSGAPAVVATSVAAAPLAADTVLSAPEVHAAATVTAWRMIGRYLDADKVFDLTAATLAEPSGVTAADTLARAGMFAALSLSAVRRDYAARADARRARETLSGLADPVLVEASAVFGTDVFAWVAESSGQAALAVSRIGADRAPLVRVESGISLPSAVAAYVLYGDANRAGELVARNRVATPALMPAVFEALAP